MSPAVKSAPIPSSYTAVQELDPSDARFFEVRPLWFRFSRKSVLASEAYAEPINASDTGYMSRNLWCREQVRMCIELFLDHSGTFLDMLRDMECLSV
jgi:hypothetical protein